MAAPTDPPAPILVLFAHAALEKSRASHWLVDAARGLSGITLHDLYEEYPDFDIDVHREQASPSHRPRPRRNARTHTTRSTPASIRSTRETVDTSLRAGVDALRLLGVRAYRAMRSARTFLRHDEAAVRDLAGMGHDRRSYFNVARLRTRDLEALLW